MTFVHQAEQQVPAQNNPLRQKKQSLYLTQTMTNKPFSSAKLCKLHTAKQNPQERAYSNATRHPTPLLDSQQTSFRDGKNRRRQALTTPFCARTANAGGPDGATPRATRRRPVRSAKDEGRKNWRQDAGGVPKGGVRGVEGVERRRCAAAGRAFELTGQDRRKRRTFSR